MNIKTCLVLVLGLNSALAADVPLGFNYLNNKIDLITPTEHLATDATTGFLKLPTMSGQPTGTPVGYGDYAPVVVDVGNRAIWIGLNDDWNMVQLTSIATILKELVSSEGFELVDISRNENDLATNAVVLWPDGTYGVFYSTSNNPTWNTVDSFTVTHTNSGKTITQPAVIRNGSGAVTNKPALIVTP